MDRHCFKKMKRNSFNIFSFIVIMSISVTFFLTLNLGSLHRRTPVKVCRNKSWHSTPMVNFSALPIPGVFYESTFYGDKTILKNRWYFKPRPIRVSPLNYCFFKHSARACTTNKIHQLVILVMSLHHMTSQRQAIRDTWGSVSTLGTWPGTTEQFSIKLLFVLGASKTESLNIAVAIEAVEKGDLIMVDVDDNYYNLATKVLMGFKWIKEFCPIVKHVMKVDEDTYINIPQFVALINSRDWNNLIYGPYFPSAPVERDGKSMVSEEAYPIAVYPPHVKGNMYCMSATVAMEILAVSEYMPYVNMEDAYITGILAKILDVRHAGIPGELYNLHSAATPCELATGNKMVSQEIFKQTFYRTWAKVIDPSLC